MGAAVTTEKSTNRDKPTVITVDEENLDLCAKLNQLKIAKLFTLKTLHCIG